MMSMSYQEKDIDIDYYVVMYASYCNWYSKEIKKPYKSKFIKYVKEKHGDLIFISDFKFAYYCLNKCKNIFDDLNCVNDNVDSYSFILDVDTFQTTDPKKPVYKIIVNKPSYKNKEKDMKKILDEINTRAVKEKARANKIKLKSKNKRDKNAR